MKIYYFGELIEENGVKITEVAKEKTEILEQTELKLDSAKADAGRKAGMQSIGELLKDIDMNLDSFRAQGSPRRSHA